MPLAPGGRIGPYEVSALIGEGGMGKVWRARDTVLRRQVAIKTLPEGFAADPERLARFEREAQVLAALNHPNIAHVYGLERSGGTLALVMELVEGPTLAERLAGRRAGPFGPAGAAESEGPGLHVDEALAIAKQIAEALEAAHEQGIVHRDLKPANIKVREDGTVKVLDFGLAKLQNVGSEAAGRRSEAPTAAPTITSPAMMTGAGTILGTAAYMSPEQARGKPVDRRADIWAFGCVLYEMLTGRGVFEDEDVSMTLSRVLQREPDFDALPPAVPAHVRQTLRMCLRKSLRERIPDIGAVRLALEGAFEAASPQSRESVPVPVPAWRRLLPVAATVVATTVVAGGVAWRFWPNPEPRAVMRFAFDLPAGQQFRNPNRPVMAVSPDGRHIVYNTTSGLYVRAMDTLEPRLIPGTEAVLTTPFFSPDGQSIGYIQDGQLKRIAVSGGTPSVVGPVAETYGASWAIDDFIFVGQSQGISRLSAAGGVPEPVISVGDGERVYGPQLLPDGDTVLFSISARGVAWDKAEVVAQSLRTGARTVLVRGGSDARYLRTGHLVYAVGEELFGVAFDAARLTIHGGPVPLVQGVTRSNLGQTGAAQFSVSNQGTLVYVTPASAERARTLVWVDRQRREMPLGTPPRAYLYPRLSPDGSRVALDVRDQQEDIWIWDVARATLARLTFDPAQDSMPVWSPDGRRIVFSSLRGDGIGRLYSQAADGTGAAELLADNSNPVAGVPFPTVFTPDGSRLLFHNIGIKAGNNADLFVVSTQGERRETPLVQTPLAQRNADVSPDGKWVAYESEESGQLEVYVRPFPNVEAGRWLVSNGGGTRPLWARTGRELFYLAGPGRVMAVPVQTRTTFAYGNPRVVIDGPYLAAGNFRTYDVSSDGERFLMIKAADGTNDDAAPPAFVVVEHWTEELKRLIPTE